jgi:hypothetical protein
LWRADPSLRHLCLVARKAQKKIDVLAREGHFLDHLAPIWLKLPEEIRGDFFTHPHFFDRARAQGIAPTDYAKLEEIKKKTLPLSLTASYADMKLSRNLGRLTVITEHGAGQSYLGVKSGSYLRSTDRAGVVAILVPGRYQAKISEEVHPAIPVYPIGVPKLDPWHRKKKDKLPKEAKGVVGFSTHWDCKVCPETRSSLRHFRGALPQMNKRFNLLGHAHPRIAGVMEGLYKKQGIEYVSDFSELVDQAEVYVCDNSSTIFEWASLDRPVVLLNAPWYRRDVEHGLLFWEYRDIGLQVDQPRHLAETIKAALADPPYVAERRRQIIRQVYGACDGRAASRAAKALQEILERWT